MKEGLRRVVRVVSVVAWLCLVAGVAGGIAALTGRDPSVAYFSIGAGVAGFALIQGLAWVIAGFSGNAKGVDGLVRLKTIWPERRKTATQASTVPLQERRTNWKIWIVGVVAWAIGWSVVKQTRQPVDFVRAEAAKYFQRPENQQQYIEIMGSLSKDPDFLAAIKQAKPGEAMQLGAKLGEQGLPTLPDYMLLQRAYIYSQLLDRSDIALCGRLVKGATTSADYPKITAALETLSPNDVGDWLRLSRAAIDAALKKNQGSSSISVAQAEEALQLITTKYTASQRRDLGAFFDGPNRIPDATACQVGKDLYKAALATPKEKRAFVARMLVAN